MAEIGQCDNCGAALTAEDQFCGECGAPRTLPGASNGSASTELGPGPAPRDLGPLEPSGTTPGESIGPNPDQAGPVLQSDASRMVRWRVTVVVLVGLGILACLAGVLAFLLFGSIGGEDLTVEENWLIASVCCLLPISGLGALLLAVGGTLWYTRVARTGSGASGKS